MSSGKIFIGLGLALVILGLILSYAPGLVSWFGRLPGDIRIENENSSVFIPVTSMIVASVILSLVVNLLFRR